MKPISVHLRFYFTAPTVSANGILYYDRFCLVLAFSSQYDTENAACNKTLRRNRSLLYNKMQIVSKNHKIEITVDNKKSTTAHHYYRSK